MFGTSYVQDDPGCPTQPGDSTGPNQSDFHAYTPSPGFVAQPPTAAPYKLVPLGTTNQKAMSGTSYVQDDPVTGRAENFEFSDKSIRRGFIRKVYAILMVQLLMTVAFIAWFTYHEPTKHYVQEHQGILFGAFAVAIVFCFGLTIFAIQTKWDFTGMGGALFVTLIILVIFGIVAIFIPGKIMNLIYASCGALLFSLYLIYDTQLMIGGEHKYSISPEEYIFAALNLYLDIVNIFLYILRIIGESRR
ncbi:hypothetical protein B7P43_G12481 [Cryptotermes secundus]|uniref:Protein lifeguard 1 n=1 Tax=Cryptotermes secundus TaxID=105785 RepID=A0A2J7PPX8_9NEOP|nr:hypothetical protein B7P43_G12481 [Cryptotermes secundus]